MQRVIELARVVRERHARPIKTPLRELVVVHPDESFLSDIAGEHMTLAVVAVMIRGRITVSLALPHCRMRCNPDPTRRRPASRLPA